MPKIKDMADLATAPVKSAVDFGMLFDNRTC